MPLIKLNNRSIKDVTSLPFGVGNMILISSQTASNSASISFTTGINSTYKEYQFYFIDIHPRTNNVEFRFQASTDGGSNYGVTITSTNFTTWHNEGDAYTFLGYRTGKDLAQSTAFQTFGESMSNDSDHSFVGTFSLFNPASTTYVKHFITNTQYVYELDDSVESFTAGYFNTTSAINAVRFQMESGNFDGTIAMFGVL
jgi:hypothetical protein